MKIFDDYCALLMTAVSSEDIASDGPVHNRGSSTDFMTFWSTVPGFASFRHEIEGKFTNIVLITTPGVCAIFKSS